MLKCIRSLTFGQYVPIFFFLTILFLSSGTVWSAGNASPKGTNSPSGNDSALPAGVICDGPGPCIIDPATGKPKQAKQAFGGQAKIDPSGINDKNATSSLPYAHNNRDPKSSGKGQEKENPAVNNVALRRIDIEKEPWLIESANLPVNHPALTRDRIIWADSILWSSINDIVPAIPVEKWLTPLPKDLAGKYVLVEFWATWCPPCRRSLHYLNYLAEKYKDDLVVVAICEMEEEAIRKITGTIKLPDMKFSVAVDTGRRLANILHVTGIPHALLLEPIYGGVVWEGMPTLPSYELSPPVLEKIMKIGRKLRSEGKLPKEAQIKFLVKKATDQERAARKKKHCSSYTNQDVPGEAGGGPSVSNK